MFEKIDSFINKLNKCYEFYSVLLLFAVIIAVSIQVFFRYVVKSPLVWIEEVSRVLFIWMIFIGCGVAHRRVLHPGVDFFVENTVLKNYRHIINFFVKMYVLVFLVFLFYFGMKLSMNLKLISMPTTGISQFYLYLSIPLASAIMIINQIYFIVAEYFYKEIR